MKVADERGPMPLRDIAEEFGLSREQIRQNIESALAKLRRLAWREGWL